MDPNNVTGAYSPPVGKFPKVHGEQFKPEFQERQARRHREFLARRSGSMTRKAEHPVDPKDVGPLYP